MTKRNLFLAILLVTTTAAISIAAVLLWSRSRSQPSWASQTSSAPVNSSAAVAQLKSPAPDAAKEGIKVHGEWTIEIRNPDGKLVERREFKNDLVGMGATLLADFLQRSAKAGEWGIHVGEQAFNPATSTSPCINGDSNANCFIAEPFSNRSGSNVFKTLTISSGTANTNIGTIRTTVLSGTATAQRDGVIRGVVTYLSSCPVEATGVCSSGANNIFTSKNINLEAVNVVAGQIIQVKVVISFS